MSILRSLVIFIIGITPTIVLWYDFVGTITAALAPIDYKQVSLGSYAVLLKDKLDITERPVSNIDPGYRFDTFSWSWVVSPVLLNKNLFYDEFDKHVVDWISYWNNNTEKIWSYIRSCDKIISNINTVWKYWTWNIALQNEGYEISFSSDDIMKIYACYVKERHYVNSQINTDYASYREHNVWTALSLFNNTVWKAWTQLKAYDTIFNSNANYVEWLWIKIVDWKPEEFKVIGWSVCGVSTIIYQNALKTFWMNIDKRLNHTNYYKIYYWPIVWLDATIFGIGKTPTRDLIVKNDTWINVFITTYHSWKTSKKSFTYWMNYFAPFVQKNTILKETYKDKKKCIINTIKKADWTFFETKSCYQNIY